MAEAFARMHLRDNVRQDDIDHAIAVTIKSFISAQKHSVKASLSKVFDKYISIEKDDFELLHHLCSELQQEIIRYNFYQKDTMPSQVSFDIDDLVIRVSVVRSTIYDVIH
jgi:DNA replication licensing factor MCM2